MNTYVENITNNIQKNNLLFFFIAAFLLQMISIFFKPYSNIYIPPAIATLYSFINLPFRINQLIIGGIISTFTSYYIYNFLSLFGKINVYLFNTLTFTFVLFIMILFNCISIPALAYSLSSYSGIPTNKFNYLSSYIIATIIILLISVSLLFTMKIFNKNNISSSYDQLEKNITNTT